MRTRRSKKRNMLVGMIVMAVLAAILIGVTIALINKISELKEPKPTPDPHEGQVYLYDGFDWIWYTPLEGVPVNELTEEKFSSAGGQPEFIGSGYDVLRGIDVSDHQNYINWTDVAASGIDFAYIRVGWRGYTEGGLYQDDYFEYNIRSATEAGLDVGVYMFSQAVTVQEAFEEANFVLERISGYNVSLPIVYDWEKVEDSNARTADLSMSTRTDCAVAFCEAIKNAGYEPCVYFNRNIGYYGYDLTRLTDYEFWFSLPEQGFPNFYYACDMWQYSFSETVPGIEGPTDMNLRFIPKPVPTPEPEITAEPEIEQKPRKGLKLFSR